MANVARRGRAAKIGLPERVSKFSVFKYGFEIIHIIEIFDRIARLCRHPFVLYHQINDFAEITRGFYAPVTKHKQGQPAPLFDCEVL